MKMHEVKCRGCGDKKLINVSYEGAIGKMTKLTGFVWIPTAGDVSPWLCRKCAGILMGLLKQIKDLVGELYTYPPTAEGILKQYLEKTTKVIKG